MESRPLSLSFLGDAWNLLRKDFGTYIVSLLLIMAITGVISVPFGLINQLQMSEVLAKSPSSPTVILTSPTYWAITLINSVFQCFALPLTAGLSRIALRQLRGETAGVGNLFDLEGQYWKLVGYFLVYSLGIQLCLLLFLVPGLVLGGLLLPAPLLIIERRMALSEALHASVEAVKPQVWAAALLFAGTLVAVFAGMCLCFVGILVTAPLLYVVGALVYHSLFDQDRKPTFQAGEYFRPPANN